MTGRGRGKLVWLLNRLSVLVGEDDLHCRGEGQRQFQGQVCREV